MSLFVDSEVFYQEVLPESTRPTGVSVCTQTETQAPVDVSAAPAR